MQNSFGEQKRPAMETKNANRSRNRDKAILEARFNDQEEHKKPSA